MLDGSLEEPEPGPITRHWAIRFALILCEVPGH
jgi:hypothetical protein